MEVYIISADKDKRAAKIPFKVDASGRKAHLARKVNYNSLIIWVLTERKSRSVQKTFLHALHSSLYLSLMKIIGPLLNSLIYPTRRELLYRCQKFNFQTCTEGFLDLLGTDTCIYHRLSKGTTTSHIQIQSFNVAQRLVLHTWISGRKYGLLKVWCRHGVWPSAVWGW